MNFMYTPDELKESGEMIFFEFTEEGFKGRTFYIEKVTDKSVLFKDAVPVFGYIKRVPIERVLDAKIKVTGIHAGHKSSFYVYCNAFVLPKDVEIVREAMLKLASKEIDDRIKQLENQRDLLNSF